MSTDTLDSMLRGVASTPSVRPPLRPGETLGGRYVIEAVIGQGGMGTVYRALDEKLGETVALKVMTGALDEQVLRDEVRLAQKVTHPNVCRTFDLEDVDGYHLVKMELVSGETLSHRLRREPKLPVDDCVRIARAIAAGLGAAHDKKIVHGDLKPGNVMLDGERVVLMDFGVARIAADPLDGVRGTVGYMAPELVREGKADERADIYALGCVLYEMLVGEPVFSGASPVVIAARQASEPAPDVRDKRPETPRWLARSIARMLEKRPADRIAGLSILVAGPRSRVRVVVPLVLASIACAAVVWTITRKKPWVPDVHHYEVFDENGDIMSFSPDGEWIVFASDRRDGEHWRAYVMSRRTGETTPIVADRAAFFARFTRDGKSVVFHDYMAHRVFRQPIAGTPPRAAGSIEDLGPGWVYDDCGDALLLVEQGNTSARVLLRFPDGRLQQLYVTEPGALVETASCAPDGRQIAIVAGAGHQARNDVYLADRLGNVRRVTMGYKIGAATFAADGRSLIVSRAAADKGGKLQMFEMALDGKSSRRLLVDEGPDRVSEVSRDGRFLTFVRDDDAYFPVITSATGSQYLTRKRGIFRVPREVSANLIVAERNDADGNRVVLIHADTQDVSVLARGQAPFPSLDGQTIYFVGNDDPKTLLAISTSGTSASPVATLPARIQRGDAGPDGLHVVVEGSDHKIASYLISEQRVTPENASGLVTVAPGGWRAVTVYGDKLRGQGAELYLVPPGRPLDDQGWHFPVDSLVNDWQDDHRIGYCVRERCEILDVRAHDITKVVDGRDLTDIADMVAIMRDGKRVLGVAADGRVTHHIITNFDER